MRNAELDALKAHALHTDATSSPLTGAATGWGILLALCLTAPTPTWQQISARQSDAARQGVESASIAHARELYRQRALVAQNGRAKATQISAAEPR